MSIGNRIAEERKRLRMTQVAFAEKIGVSLSSQKRYETSERMPNIVYLGTLEKVGVNIAYVMTGSDTAINNLKFYSALDTQAAELLAIAVLDLDKEGFAEAVSEITHTVGTPEFLRSALDSLIKNSPPLLERLNSDKIKNPSFE